MMNMFHLNLARLCTFSFKHNSKTGLEMLEGVAL